MDNEYIVEMLNITKEFPGIKANDNITVKLKKGEVLALLGENGAGKSTLMSVLFGLYTPEKGTIKINGKNTNIKDPNDANKLGIGMVHQHFKLVHNFTVAENIILGVEPVQKGVLHTENSLNEIKKLSNKYNLKVNPNSKIEDITVGMQQRVEILKMLYRKNDILIFDEPTAVLTPDEIIELMSIINQLKEEGKSIIIITHKLDEIKEVADRCTVLRKGKSIDTVIVKDTSKQQLAELMVGRDVDFSVAKEKAVPKGIILETKSLTLNGTGSKKKLSNVNINVRSGEIVTIAGIDNNGQSELVYALTGMIKNYTGKIKFAGKDISDLSIRERTKLGIGHIPEDRHKHGLVLDFPMYHNMVLQNYFEPEFSKKFTMDYENVKKYSKEIINRFDVRSGEGEESIARGLSGGNQQKAIIGREIYRNPDLLIAVQPTRGLDVGAIEFVHSELIKHRDAGKAVLLISLEMDEVLNLSDRIYVMFEGQIYAELEGEKTNRNEIGLFMSGSERQ